MVCTHPANWSVSSRNPIVGSRMTRMTAPSVSPAARASRSRLVHRADEPSGPIDSDAASHPVAFRGAIDFAEAGHRLAVGPRRFGHVLAVLKEPVDLAGIEPDPGDLSFELVADVGVLGDQAHVRRELGEGLRVQVGQPAEAGPPRVWEVLVEAEDARVVGSGHNPSPALAKEPDAGIAAQPVVDVATHPQRQIDVLWLEACDLPAERLERRLVIGPWRAEELPIALVPAEHGIGQVEEHDRRLGEVGEPLVLDASRGHQIARRGGIHDVVRHHRALGRNVVHDGLVGERFVVDAGASIPRGSLPEPFGRRVRVRLGRLQSIVGSGPCGHEDRLRIGREDVAAIEGFGDRPMRLGAESESLTLVGRESVATSITRIHGDDRDVLTELAEARDESAARERDVVRVGRDEDMGHGRPSIPSVIRADQYMVSGKPPGPTSGTNTHAPWGDSSHSCPCRTTSMSTCWSRGPTGITRRPPSASWSRSSAGMAGAAAVTTIPSYGALAG